MDGLPGIVSRPPMLPPANVRFTTYRLHALAGNGNIPVADVLRVLVLQAVAWLKGRLRPADIPPELDLPAPEDYASLDPTSIRSLRVEESYRIDIVWLPQERNWTLQLIEPDQGFIADKNRPRANVPGRQFETSCAFRIAGDRVECGFLLAVSQPDGSEDPDRAFRLTSVDDFARNALVGLSDTYPLGAGVNAVTSDAEVRRLAAYLKDPSRSLLAVVVADAGDKPDAAAAFEDGFMTGEIPDDWYVGCLWNTQLLLAHVEMLRVWAKIDIEELVKSLFDDDKRTGDKSSVAEDDDKDDIAQASGRGTALGSIGFMIRRYAHRCLADQEEARRLAEEAAEAVSEAEDEDAVTVAAAGVGDAAVAAAAETSGEDDTVVAAEAAGEDDAAEAPREDDVADATGEPRKVVRVDDEDRLGFYDFLFADSAMSIETADAAAMDTISSGTRMTRALHALIGRTNGDFLSDVAESCMDYALVFKVEPDKLELLSEICGRNLTPGQTVLWKPGDAAAEAASYLTDEVKGRLGELIRRQATDACTDNEASFGSVMFASEAHELEDAHAVENSQSVDALKATIREMRGQRDCDAVKVQETLSGKDATIVTLREQAERARMEGVAEERKRSGRRIAELEELVAARDARIDMLESEVERLHIRLKRPDKPADVPAWVEQSFEGRLIMSDRATDEIDGILKNDIDVDLLCDAIEFLAMDYRDFRMGKISIEEMNVKQSNKYRRPFMVGQTSQETLQKYKKEYTIKYDRDHDGKRREVTIGDHIGVGTDSENLLRIYLYYDTKGDTVVIGSLPRHLHIVTYH